MKVPYRRDPDAVNAHLKEQDDGGLFTEKACKIQIPERYLGRHLASIGAEVHILGIFAIIMEDSYYAVSITNAMMHILPASTETVEIDGETYLEFYFQPGDTVFHSTNLVKNDIITYYIYDEFVAKGRIPWYLNYFDLARLFETAKEHAGINLGNRAVLDLIISTIARDPKEIMRLYRHAIFKPADVERIPPKVVPFRSVIYNTSDTTSKLIGAYFGDGISSALVNPSERVERIEELLRT